MLGGRRSKKGALEPRAAPPVKVRNKETYLSRASDKLSERDIEQDYVTHVYDRLDACERRDQIGR